MSENKKCTKCGKVKPLSQYWLNQRLQKHIACCRDCQSADRKKYKARNKEYLYEKEKERRKKPEVQASVKESSRRWIEKNREYLRQAAKRWRLDNPDKYTQSLAKGRADAYKLKIETFSVYGGSKCSCCGEKEILFLTIDHIAEDGSAHRKKYGITGGLKTYRWLKKNGYPKGFQVLCMKCNWGKKNNKGICPHKDKRFAARAI